MKNKKLLPERRQGFDDHRENQRRPDNRTGNRNRDNQQPQYQNRTTYQQDRRPKQKFMEKAEDKKAEGQNV